MVELHPEHARALLAELAIGVVVLDHLERVTWVNDHAARLLTISPAALLGADAALLPLPYAASAAEGGAPAAAVHGNLVGFTQIFEHASGTGAVIMLYERGHALIGFLDALASGLGGLTTSGVLTRATIRSRLEAEVSRSRRYANPLSCVTLRLTARLDDGTLPDLARALKEQLRWVDLLGRWAPEVLLVVLPETAGPAAEALSDKLLTALSQASALDGASVEVGRATWRRGDTAERMVDRALHAGRAVPLRSPSRRRR